MTETCCENGQVGGVYEQFHKDTVVETTTAENFPRAKLVGWKEMGRVKRYRKIKGGSTPRLSHVFFALTKTLSEQHVIHTQRIEDWTGLDGFLTIRLRSSRKKVSIQLIRSSCYIMLTDRIVFSEKEDKKTYEI